VSVVSYVGDLVGEYGRAVHAYNGVGAIHTDDEHAFPCEFAACQYDSGRIALACDFDPPSPDILFARPARFHARLESGATLSTERPINELPIVRALPQRQQGAWAVYTLADLTYAPREVDEVVDYRFVVTNYQPDPMFFREPMRLDLPRTSARARISMLDSAFHELEAVRALRDIRPTAELRISAVSDVDEARFLADSLCYIISAARGTKVQWTVLDELADGGFLVRRVHENRVTKPFSPFAPIDASRIKNLKGFIEQVYPTYVERKDDCRLDRGTIDFVLDGKVEGDHLETRAVKLAIAVETLLTNAADAIIPDARFILDPKKFEELAENLSAAVARVLQQAGVKRDLRDAIHAPRKVRGLNRRSFRHRLKKLASRLGLRMSESEIRLFVACRNSLVHSSEFYCNSATDDERHELPPKASPFAEYLFIMDVIDRVLLKLMGYAGPYLARSKDGSSWTSVDI